MSKCKSIDEVMAEAYAAEGLAVEDILGVPDVVSSGNLALDYCLGIGGFPRGRSVELAGLSQSGKTTCAAMAAAQAQRQGLPVVYLDFEQSLDEPYLQALGVDTEDRKLFIPYPPSSLEQGMEAAHKAASTGSVGLIIFDSVAAMTPRSAVEDYNDSRTMAMDRARVLGNTISALNPILARTKTAAIFINHVRDVIETGPVRPGMPKRTTTPGGTSLKFYATIRCEFKVVKTFKHDRWDALTGKTVSEPHAVFSQVKVTKNKCAPPFRTAELYLEFGKGFNNTHAAMTALVGNGVVSQSGSYYYFPDSLYHPQMKSGNNKGPSIQGLQSVLDLAEFDPEWSRTLVGAALSVLDSSRGMEQVVAAEAVDEIGAESTDEESAGEEPSVEEPVAAPPAPVLSSGMRVRFVGDG